MQPQKHSPKHSKRKIIEIIIVVVFTAALIYILSVLYTNVSRQERDTQRQANVSTIVKALREFYSKGKPDLSCGEVSDPKFGNTSLPKYGHYMSGFFSHDYDGDGDRKSIEQCLVDAKFIDAPIVDEAATDNCKSGSRDCYSYMVATCIAEDEYETYVYTNLEVGDYDSKTLTDKTCQIADTYDTEFGMNYWRRVH